MRKYPNRVVLALVCAAGAFASPSLAQTVRREREATVTGPRGRTIDRRIEVERGRGTVDRRVEIQRPGMTLQRGFSVQGAPPPPVVRGRGGPVVIERNVYVNPRPSSSWAFGFGVAPMLTVPLWAPPPPPPVVVAPAPVVAAPGPAAVVATPRAPAPQPSPLDPVALAAQRLQSHHAGSRREGAETLGRLGDPRAIPALVHTLKYDSSKDVKIAAVQAVGAIGGPEAETVLERCIIYEKKQEVRDAAAIALRDLRARPVAEVPARPSLARRNSADPFAPKESVVPKVQATPPPPRTSPFRRPADAEEPALEGPASETPEQADGERIPPPPPTPVQPE